MKDLAVVFPGRRYSVDRSLLHFPSRMLENLGYEMIYLRYDLPKEKEDPRSLEDCFKDSLAYTKLALQDLDFQSYDHIVFLSKSIGTAVAGEIEKENALENVHQIFVTPLVMTVPYLEKKDLIIASDSDPYFPESVDRLSSFDNSYIFPKCPHSFEFKGNYSLTMKMLSAYLGVVDKYLKSILWLDRKR